MTEAGSLHSAMLLQAQPDRFMAANPGLPMPRRAMLGGMLAAGALALTGCQTTGGISFTEAIRRLLLLSSERAFARMMAPGGYWDEAVRTAGLGSFLGNRGDILSGILTSALFRNRLEDAFAGIAVDASYRAAPVVADAVRMIGIDNAIALIRGGPSAATGFLQGQMGNRLIDVMVPEVGEALRVAREPLVGQVLAALTGVNVTAVANGFAGQVDSAIWREIGREEAAIRADPAATRDPLLIAALTGASVL